tara:strand:- start:186 stop:512 length:327 start_codon:yes stop_codon:yes gene_type:complete
MANEVYKSVYPAHRDRNFKTLADLRQFYTSINPDKIEMGELLENPMNLNSEKKIKKIQNVLKRLGLLAEGSVSGLLDQVTARGIKAYKSAILNEMNPDMVKRTLGEQS